jgi:hypothetical protein
MHNTWVQTSDSANAGPGGGGGGGGDHGNSASGANYGAGGAGASDADIAGSGAQGIIVITYGEGKTTLTSNVTVTATTSVIGAISKGSGSFVIDHPLDPKNKLLYHSFFESPDAKNWYDGITELDKDGKATIELPSYFLALNKDFRYLGTPLGEPMPNLHLSVEVRKRFLGLWGTPMFKIAGGEPNGRVSWQVTGIRHDPYILARPIVPEVEKGPGQIVPKGECLFKPLCE